MSTPSSRFTQGLNPEQRAAVLHSEGPLLVVAGAGSGKTSVVTRRIARMIASGEAAPGEVLAVTFTNKAAAEMRGRVAELSGRAAKGAEGPVISTFHSFCLSVLRKHIDALGYRKNFTVSGEGDARTLIRRVLGDLEGVAEAFSPASFLEAISLMKNRDEDPANADSKAGDDNKYRKYLPEVYRMYESALRAANSLDFDDLLRLTLRLWREHPDALEQTQSRFKFVMVDEYQDTNPIQYALIRQLAAPHRNVCVVGDDDQSIYGWRGADLSNILHFEKDYPDATVVTLKQNYRSTETILKAANGVIAHNRARRVKAMWSAMGAGRAIDWLVTGDDEHEAKTALAWMENIQSKSGAEWSDFAFLYRSNTQSRPFEIVLRQAGVPYTVVGGQDFFERAEVRDAIAYLKLVANPRDEAAFLRIVNVPRRGIGDVTLHTVHDLCRERGISFGMAMAEALKTGRINGQAEEGVRSFLGLLNDARARFREGSGGIADKLRGLLAGIGYREELERTSKTKEHADLRWENVQAVVRAIEQYETDAPQPSLAGFLDESALNSEPDRASRDEQRKNGVTLMTIHSAKGLEFPFVFVVGVEEGLMPHEKSLREDALEEERRLFYVALTRAKRHITLFEALSRSRHGRERMTTTSRFVREIPAELIKKTMHAARDMVEARVDPPRPKPKPKTRAATKAKAAAQARKKSAG